MSTRIAPGRAAWPILCTVIVLGVAATYLPPGLAQAATVVIQRTTVYVSTLPKGCVKTTYSGGVVVWKCGGVYYQPYNGRYVRVYIR